MIKLVNMSDETIIKVVPDEKGDEVFLVVTPAFPTPRFMDDREIKTFCGECDFVITTRPDSTGCSEPKARERQLLYVARKSCSFLKIRQVNTEQKTGFFWVI